MKRKSMLMMASIVASAAVAAISSDDKYTLKLPNGLAFSEFRGYENWQVVSVSQTPELLKVEVANPTMIEAYRSGIPGNGKPFPDGSKIAKIEWKPKKMAVAVFSKRARHLAGCLSDRERQQAIPGHQGMGLCRFDYTPRPTRSSRIPPARSIAVSRATRSSRTRITFFTHTRNGEEKFQGGIAPMISREAARGESRGAAFKQR